MDNFIYRIVRNFKRQVNNAAVQIELNLRIYESQLNKLTLEEIISLFQKIDIGFSASATFDDLLPKSTSGETEIGTRGQSQESVFIETCSDRASKSGCIAYFDIIRVSDFCETRKVSISRKYVGIFTTNSGGSTGNVFAQNRTVNR